MKKMFLPLLFLVLVTSCNHTYYIPTTHNVPLFKEKNEFRATVSRGGGSEITTTDIQAAYSISNNLAVLTNVMFARGEGEQGNTEDWGKGQCLELGFGYFNPLGKFGVFEIYGGIGGSNQYHEYTSGGKADLLGRRVFIQPSLGLSFNVFDLALTSGISSINFYRINNQINPMSDDFTDLNRISMFNRSMFLEPALTIRAGWQHLKFQFQFGLSKNLTNPDLNFEDYKLSLGLSIALNRRFNNRKDAENKNI